MLLGKDSAGTPESTHAKHPAETFRMNKAKIWGAVCARVMRSIGMVNQLTIQELSRLTATMQTT